MPLVLESIRNGDRELFEKHPSFDNANIYLHLQNSGSDYEIEKYGKPSDYAISR